MARTFAGLGDGEKRKKKREHDAIAAWVTKKGGKPKRPTGKNTFTELSPFKVKKRKKIKV
jgi:hypothetical protein